MERCRNPWRARSAKPIMGIWGLSPQWGPGAKPLVMGSGELKALFYFKAVFLAYFNQIHKCFSLYKFIIIVHLMMLKSEVVELRYEVAGLSSGELRLTFTTAYICN